MKQKLEQRSRLALAVYEQAGAVMAQRAGESLPLAPDEYGATIAQAQRLALPEQTHAEGPPPALTSLVGHLFGHQAHGYYHPAALPADADTVMPKADRPANLVASYAALWKQFAPVRDKLLTGADAPAVQEVGYHALLQRFAWAMPAPDVGDSDVSLFDFARTSAALAVCLADGVQGNQPQAQNPVALLIGGDVSGVQDWLYTIGSSGAAKSLRGRSVYLQLLSEIIALYVLDELGLPSCNLLYVGGGNFYVLAPLSAETALKELQREISRRLLAMHGGALYLALGWAQVARADLEQQQTGDVWNRVNRKMGAAKRQRFSELDDEDMGRAIGEPLEGTGLLQDSCAICRRPIVKGEKAKRADEDDPTNSARNCELCESFSKLGNELPHAHFLVVTKLSNQSYADERINHWQDGLRAFGYDVQFLEHAQTSKRAWSAGAGAEQELVRIYYWQEDDGRTFPGNLAGHTCIWIYRPLAQAAPIDYQRQGQPIATFDELRTEGIQRWGVLRMDVDNLGQIFQRGLPGSSLSRVVSLSAQMRLLFEGYVPQMMEEYNHDHPQSTYLMYAGGDDLFIVAGWSHLPELAAKVRDALIKFAVGNPRVTISGGVSLALDDNYPIYQAARAAGRAEEMAKDAGKNRLALLGQAVPWEGDDRCNYVKVRERVEQLKQWLDGKGGEGKLNRSFLMRLRAIDAEWQEWRQEERRREQEQERERREQQVKQQQAKQQGQASQQTEQPDKRKYPAPRYTHADKRLYLGPWQWHMVYDLHRAGERSRDKKVQTDIEQMVNDIVAGEITVLGLEARWMELLTREKQRAATADSTSQTKEAA